MELFRAVIENNVSPKKDGRVQVRINGIHDDNLSVVKTAHLPWAEVMQSTAFGFSSGVGFSSIPNIGTWVFVTLDHGNRNMPIIIGAISGKSAYAADTSLGFNSPDGVFPLSDRLGEEDQNRLQRVENLDKTIHKLINDTIDTVSKTDSKSGADVSQTEPDSLNDKSTYPDNAVIETKSGHVIEIDDTVGNERVRIYHKSGSYTEYRPDGSIVQKSVGAIDHLINMGDVQKHVQGYVKEYLEKNLEQIISGGLKQSVEMDNFQHIAGFTKIQADGSLEIIGDVKITGNLVSSGEVADSQGNLSSLRDAYDAHYHIGNLGIPTTPPINTDPKIRFSWSSSPLGFK
jgi:hypothetical protein